MYDSLNYQNLRNIWINIYIYITRFQLLYIYILTKTIEIFHLKKPMQIDPTSDDWRSYQTNQSRDLYLRLDTQGASGIWNGEISAASQINFVQYTHAST